MQSQARCADHMMFQQQACYARMYEHACLHFSVEPSLGVVYTYRQTPVLESQKRNVWLQKMEKKKRIEKAIKEGKERKTKKLAKWKNRHNCRKTKSKTAR